MANEQYWYASGGNALGGWTKASESFITGDAYTLVSVYLPLQQGLYTTGDAHIYLYAVDESHYPTGEALLEIGTITAGELTGSVQWIEFSGLNYSMSASTEYAIVIEIDNYNETYNEQTDIPQIRWLSKSGYAGTPAHQYWYDDAGTWRHTTEYSIVATADFGFITVSGDLPSKPTTPSPTNTATGVDFSERVLDWVDGGGADTFDVYMGPSGALVKIADAIVPSTYTVDLEDVPKDQVIYWRVDATNNVGTTTGDVWNFDARPIKATTPSPADAVSDITLDETPLGWVDGGNADTYNVYFGESGNEVLVASLQADVEWTITFGLLDYEKTYGWRIDSVNDFGTTTGDTWTFSSIVFDPVLPTGITLVDGEPTGTPDGENNMITVKRLVAAAENAIWYEDL